MKVISYARVSSETQAKEGTIQSQIESLREYARANNLTILAECLDDGYSGADLNRPGLDQLRDMAAAGTIEAVLILSPDRLSRKQAHQIILLEEFKKRNIQVIFTTQPAAQSAEDQLMLNIQGAVSEYERAKILDRTRRGTLHATKNGQVIGSNPPYAYRYVSKTKDHPATYAKDESEAEIVKVIFNWFILEGMKGTQIAKRLEQEGYPSRSKYGKWWNSSIYAILKNETYTGTAYMYKTRSTEPQKHPKAPRYRQRTKSSKADRPKSEWIGIPVPAILDRGTWQKAQDRLKENAARSRRNNSKNEYLLRGLVVCGLCGCMASGRVNNKYSYYTCNAKMNRNITTRPHDERVSIQRPTLDEKVWQGLTELLNNPAELEAQFRQRQDRRTPPTKANNAETDRITKELTKLAGQEARLIDAYRESVISLKELREQKAKIAARMKSLEAKKNAAQSAQESPGRQEITFEMLGDVSARFSRVMAKADFQTREKIVNNIVQSVTLYPDRAVVKGSIPVLSGDVLNPAHYAAPLHCLRIMLRSLLYLIFFM